MAGLAGSIKSTENSKYERREPQSLERNLEK